MTSGEKTVETQVSFEERLSAALNKNKGPIDWSSAKVQKDLPRGPASAEGPSRVAHSTSDSENWPSLPESKIAKYSELYFTHFHHRWPVIHAPIFDAETAAPALLSCVTMIGACIHGTSDSKEFAMSLHARVNDYIFARLVCPSFSI